MSKKQKLQLTKDLENSIDNFSELLRKELLGKGSRARKSIVSKVAKYLQSKMPRNDYKLLADVLFRISKGRENFYFESYIRSVYFSGDYEKFKKLRPVDVVKLVRYYFKEKDGTPKIPVEYAPMLLKLARNIKKSIKNTIKYRGGETFIPDEAIFEELKKEHENKKKYFSYRKKKQKKNFPVRKKKELEESLQT